MNFNQLDIKHKRAVISYTKLFRLAVERLCQDLPDAKKQAIVDSLCIEATDFVNFLSDEDVNDIVDEMENHLNQIIPN